MDRGMLDRIADRFAALPPGSVLPGQIWDVRDHGLALVREIERLLARVEQAETERDKFERIWLEAEDQIAGFRRQAEMVTDEKVEAEFTPCSVCGGFDPNFECPKRAASQTGGESND